MTNNNLKKSINFQAYLKNQLKDARVKKYYEEAGKKLEIAHQVTQMRKRQGISQLQLAKKLGTTQSNVARIEAGQQNFTTETLQKIAKVFKRELKIEFV